MAVLGSASERWEDRSSTYNGGVWEYTRGWLVQTDDKTDRESVVSTATGLPAYGELHPSPISDAAYCNQIAYTMTDRGDTPTAWTVTASYTSARSLDETDPTSDEVLVAWQSEIYQEPVFQDVNSQAILNSAGDYFIDPSPTRDTADLIATIQANVTSVPTWVLTYQNRVNNGSITIGGLAIAQGVAKLQRLTIGNREKRNSTTFYPLTFEIHLKEAGWRFKPLDAGFREIGYGGLVQIINDGDGEEVTTPVLLDGNGAVLANPSPSTAVFANYQVYEEKDFTVLPGVS